MWPSRDVGGHVRGPAGGLDPAGLAPEDGDEADAAGVGPGGVAHGGHEAG